MGPRAAAAADEACTCQAQRSRYWVQGKLEDGLRKREQVKGSGFNLRRVFGRIPFFWCFRQKRFEICFWSGGSKFKPDWVETELRVSNTCWFQFKRRLRRCGFGV